MPTNATIVVCLCAEWCGVCREYRAPFDAIADQHRDHAFHWADIEDEPDWPDALEIESFPTVLVQRGDAVLFLGPVLPQPGHLARLLASFATLDEAQVQAHVAATEERRLWQQAREFGRRIAAAQG